MASRVLLLRRSVAPLATLAIGAMALVPATALAEGPADPRKPIYDDVDWPATRVAPKPTPPPPPPPRAQAHKADDYEAGRGCTSPTDRLAAQIGRARTWLYACAVRAEDAVNHGMDSAFHLEQSFTDTLVSLAPPRESGEELLPGAIYVLVATMAGTIVARNRNILLRASMPLAFGIGAGWLVLPLTMRNISDLTWTYEQRFPALAQSHLRLRDTVQRSVRFARVHGELGVRYVDDQVTHARELVEGWVKQGK